MKELRRSARDGTTQFHGLGTSGRRTTKAKSASVGVHVSRQYSGPSIALVLHLWLMMGLSDRLVRDQVYAWQVRGHNARGWAQLYRWTEQAGALRRVRKREILFFEKCQNELKASPRSPSDLLAPRLPVAPLSRFASNIPRRRKPLAKLEVGKLNLGRRTAALRPLRHARDALLE